jgi:hypothetical protein
MAIEHKNIPDAQLHEVKGAASATSGQVLMATGSGTATFQTLNKHMGWWDYEDTATSSAPIALTVASTYYDLTNNGLGPNTTSTYALAGLPAIWNTATNRLNLSGLTIGDTVDIRVDLSLTTSGTNHQAEVALEFGVGTGSEYKLLLNRDLHKTADTYNVVAYGSFYIGNALTKDNPARIVAKSDSTGDTVVVNGWYIRVNKRVIA